MMHNYSFLLNFLLQSQMMIHFVFFCHPLASLIGVFSEAYVEYMRTLYHISEKVPTGDFLLVTQPTVFFVSCYDSLLIATCQCFVP